MYMHCSIFLGSEWKAPNPGWSWFHWTPIAQTNPFPAWQWTRRRHTCSTPPKVNRSPRIDVLQGFWWVHLTLNIVSNRIIIVLPNMNDTINHRIISVKVALFRHFNPTVVDQIHLLPYAITLFFISHRSPSPNSEFYIPFRSSISFQFLTSFYSLESLADFIAFSHDPLLKHTRRGISV